LLAALPRGDGIDGLLVGAVIHNKSRHLEAT